MINAYDKFPAVYGDDIFPQLATIVARYLSPNESKNRINVRLSSVRQSIEHTFALHNNTFDLFNISTQFRLMLGGVECYMLVFNSFFLLNCYACLNEIPNNFNIRPPTLEQYIPLDEVLKPAPDTTNELLGDVYNYNV